MVKPAAGSRIQVAAGRKTTRYSPGKGAILTHEEMMMGAFAVGVMGAQFKSLQYGSIEIGAASTSETAEISSVDTDKAVVVWLGTSGDADQDRHQNLRLTLTNATTVTATRVGSSFTFTIGFVVIEFESGINSVQQGTVTIPNGQTVQTATITSVDTDKAVLLPCGFTSDSAAAPYSGRYPRLTLTNATTVTATRSLENGETTVAGFVVLEFS